MGAFLGPSGGYYRLWVAQVGLGGSWTNTSGGTWGRGPNWSTGTPAMQVGNAKFDLNAAYTVAFDRDELTKTMAVNAGAVTLDLQGHTLTTESGLSIGPGAMLKGAGSIISDITNGGTLAPGNSPGTLSITGNLINTGTLEFEIASLSLFDHLNVTGALTAGGTIAIKLLAGYVPAAGDHFNLLSFGNFSESGYAFDLSQAFLAPGLAWDTSGFSSDGGISVVTIPEPSSLALLGIGVSGLFAYLWPQRRRRAQASPHGRTKTGPVRY
jgi:hypothetical protein